MKDFIKAKINRQIKEKVLHLYGIFCVTSMIITIILCRIVLYFNNNLNILETMFVWGMGFIFFLILQTLIPVYATRYAIKQEIKLLLTEDLTELKPINFHTNWETIESKKYGIKNCVINIDKDTGYIYFCKEKMDNYAHYYVVDTMYSNERMYVVQKAYDDTNNIPRILREVKVNKFVNGFKG